MELWHNICPVCEHNLKTRTSEIVKLYRIYRRVKVSGKWKFISIGWACPKCNYTECDEMRKTGEDGNTICISALNMTPEERKQWLYDRKNFVGEFER